MPWRCCAGKSACDAPLGSAPRLRRPVALGAALEAGPSQRSIGGHFDRKSFPLGRSSCKRATRHWACRAGQARRAHQTARLLKIFCSPCSIILLPCCSPSRCFVDQVPAHQAHRRKTEEVGRAWQELASALPGVLPLRHPAVNARERNNRGLRQAGQAVRPAALLPLALLVFDRNQVLQIGTISSSSLRPCRFYFTYSLRLCRFFF